jgi:hypothetical protein
LASSTAGIAPGSYWVGWIIDFDSNIVESDEGNNAGYDASGKLTVTSDGTTGDGNENSVGCTPSNTGKGPMPMLVIWLAFVAWLTLRRRGQRGCRVVG